MVYRLLGLIFLKILTGAFIHLQLLLQFLCFSICGDGLRSRKKGPARLVAFHCFIPCSSTAVSGAAAVLGVLCTAFGRPSLLIPCALRCQRPRCGTNAVLLPPLSQHTFTFTLGRKARGIFVF